MKKLILSIVIALAAVAAQAQCTYKNTAFKSGEFLTYNLYYNWQFIWVKAGTASMSTVLSKYHGYHAWRSSLTTRGNKRVDDMFVLRDTLLCYSSTKMEPLYFRKGAREGKRYTVDEVFYSYPGGKVQTRQHRLRHNGEHQWKTNTADECIFDMLSIFMRARSFNPEGWKKGNRVRFPITDGIGVIPAVLEYKGKTVVKADNGVKYNCLQLSYKELDNGKYKELVRFFVTDDDSHVPIRLDMSLKFGSAKAFLTGMKGVKGK